MATTRTITVTDYSFDELADGAKETAREWFREDIGHEWYDCVYDDAKTCGKLLGVEIDAIYFSGFASQGDGACFEGRYAYAEQAPKRVLEYAPQDEELVRIARDLVKAQRSAFYRLTADVKHRGRYYHEYATEITVRDGDGNYAPVEQDEAISTALRDFMRWIYKRLENEYDYLMSDECVDEQIRANEYRFDNAGGIV